MAIRPEDFLEGAKELSKGRVISQEEVRLRTLAGRAYYACYLELRRIGRKELGNPSFDPFHKSLCSRLKGHADQGVQEIGERLDSLRKLRTSSDYRPDQTVQKLQVQLAVVSAESVLKSAKKEIKGRFPTDVDSRA